MSKSPLGLPDVRVTILRNGFSVDDLKGVVDPNDLSALNDEIRRVNEAKPNDVRNLPRDRVDGYKIENATIETVETAIGHGLGRVPYWYSVHLHGTETWCQTREPDPKFLYLAASSKVQATILVE